MVHLALEGNEDEIEIFMVMKLLGKGYIVEKPQNWETPGEICLRLGISMRTFNRRIKNRWLPQCDIDRGGARRITRLRSNSALDAFLRLGHTSGQKSAVSGQVAATPGRNPIAGKGSERHQINGCQAKPLSPTN